MADKIRITESKPIYTEEGTKFYIGGFGKSTVTKPTEGIVQGSWIMETDTKKVKFFDENSETWG